MPYLFRMLFTNHFSFVATIQDSRTVTAAIRKEALKVFKTHYGVTCFMTSVMQRKTYSADINMQFYVAAFD